MKSRRITNIESATFGFRPFFQSRNFNTNSANGTTHFLLLRPFKENVQTLNGRMTNLLKRRLNLTSTRLPIAHNRTSAAADSSSGARVQLNSDSSADGNGLYSAREHKLCIVISRANDLCHAGCLVCAAYPYQALCLDQSLDTVLSKEGTAGACTRGEEVWLASLASR
jgi:hypothetical protein